METFKYNNCTYIKTTKEEAIKAQKEKYAKVLIVGDTVLESPEAYMRLGHIMKHDDIELEISLYEGLMDRVYSQIFDEIYFYIGIEVGENNET